MYASRFCATDGLCPIAALFASNADFRTLFPFINAPLAAFVCRAHQVIPFAMRFFVCPVGRCRSGDIVSPFDPLAGIRLAQMPSGKDWKITVARPTAGRTHGLSDGLINEARAYCGRSAHAIKSNQLKRGERARAQR